jgi:DNA-binding XRE family transcriptional regulator
MLTSRGCAVGQEFVRAQTCFRTDSLEEFGGRPVLAVNQVANGRLRHANPARKCGLGRFGSLQVRTKCSHMGLQNIGNAYSDAIGKSYSEFGHASRMPKTRQRTVLERALEALAEKYPRERASQVRLAQLAGVKQPTVNEWGDTDRYPSMSTAVKLAGNLGVCVEWLLTERGPKYAQQSTQEAQELVPLIDSLSELKDDQKRQVIRYVDFLKTES